MPSSTWTSKPEVLKPIDYSNIQGCLSAKKTSQISTDTCIEHIVIRQNGKCLKWSQLAVWPTASESPLVSPSPWLWDNSNILLLICHYPKRSFSSGPVVKNPPAMQEMRVWSLGQEDLLEEEMAPYSSILACKIPRTEELGWLQSTGSQKAGHDWARIHACSLYKIKSPKEVSLP